MSTGYWANVLTKRVSRRRAIAGTATVGAAAAFLVACGGDDDTPPSTTSTSSGAATSGGSGATGSSGSESPSLLAEKVDTSGSAVPGGVFVEYRGANVRALDPHTNAASAAFGEITTIYSTLFKYGFGLGKTPSADDIEGDALASWELSPDGLTLTGKLRPNHTFDPRPPTNGRAMTVEDVKWSFEHSIAVSPLAGDMYNGSSPIGPIESVTAPDESTVVVKMAFPYGGITELLAYWFLYIMPVEAETGFDPKVDARGSGPFRLDSWNPDTGWEYSKNPDWYVADRPYLDGISRKYIPEYATAMAQFETGALWDLTVRQEDVLRVKGDHPEMIMHQQVRGGSPGQYTLLFSQKPDDPFRDIRLRQAASHLYDRELFISTYFNLDQFEDAGLPVESFWSSHLPNQAFNWVDPRDASFGRGAENFQFNPEEARRLIDASGFSGAIDYNFRNQQGAFVDYAEIMAGGLQEGFTLNRIPLENVDWRAVAKADGLGYNGMIFSTSNSFNDVGFLVTKYSPDGKDRLSATAIPGITDKVIAAQSELDLDRRNEMVKALQQDLAEEMLDLPVVSTQPVLNFTLRWPWLQNHGVFGVSGFSEDASTARLSAQFWYDATKRS